MCKSLSAAIVLAHVLVASALTVPAATYGQATSGDYLVIDFDAGTNVAGALFTVNPVTGSRTILSDFGLTNQGPVGVDPEGVTVDSMGTILVTDPSGGTGEKGALFTVNPTSGARTVLSDFGNAAQGPLGNTPIGVTVAPSGIILVADPNAGTKTRVPSSQ